MPGSGPGASGGAPQPDPVAGIAVALAGLDGLDHRPTAAHVAAFDRVHTALTDALSAIDQV
jgi:hypothetical protein